MKKRQTPQHLTNSEQGLMEILWVSGRPLTRPEILEKAVKNQDPPLFAVNTFHVLINSLIAKGYLTAFGGSGRGRSNARHYAPTVTRNEYFALRISGSERYSPKDIPAIFAALFKYSPQFEAREVLDQMEDFIRDKREQLQA